MLSNRVGALLVFLDPGLVQRFETLGRMPEHVLGHAFWAHFFSWHLDVRINELAGDAAGALDPQEFWRAWAAGAATTVDTFSESWDFWEYVKKRRSPNYEKSGALRRAASLCDCEPRLVVAGGERLRLMPAKSHIPHTADIKTACVSAWNRDPVSGVIAIQKGLRGQRVHNGLHGVDGPCVGLL
jgi:hypothetical protein